MLFDILDRNVRIHTQDPRRPIVGALGVHHGRIISLDEEIDAAQFREVVDLRGATVLPGFNDAHCHLSMVGLAELQVDLSPDAVSDTGELLAAVGHACKAAEPGAWVIGTGYDQNRLGGQHPTAEQLDAVTGDHPVWLHHKSRHLGVANTEAFRRAGYPQRRDVPVPEGGGIPLDGEGRAQGVLLETARAAVMDHIPAPTVEDIADAVAAGSRSAVARGVTSITEPGLGAPEHIGQSTYDIAGYQRARDQGRLRVRATVMPYLTRLHPIGLPEAEEGPQGIGLDLGIRTGLGDERLRIGATKILSDGSLIGRSAYMCCDYAVGSGDDSSPRGMLQFSSQTLRERLIGAHRAGWQVAAHAIGDAALDTVLEIFAEAQRLHPREDPRHRVEHVCMASDEQLSRMQELGLIPVPQGRFVHELGDGAREAVGQERAHLTYRLKGLFDAGLPVAASTDAPVVALDPMLNVHDMVNRVTHSGEVFSPQERITLEQALRAYTVGSAYASHEEHIKGRLSHGMLADFVVLSEDPHEVASARLKEIVPTSTVVGGVPVWGELCG